MGSACTRAYLIEKDLCTAAEERDGIVTKTQQTTAHILARE
jgi:hypothetical protein